MKFPYGKSASFLAKFNCSRKIYKVTNGTDAQQEIQQHNPHDKKRAAFTGRKKNDLCHDYYRPDCNDGIVENQLYRVRPGDWMLCSPLELHQARIATDADAYERIVLWIARPYLEGLSTPRTSLTRCFDTTVPGHTNLLRLPGATGAPLRTTVDKLCALKAYTF